MLRFLLPRLTSCSPAALVLVAALIGCGGLLGPSASQAGRCESESTDCEGAEKETIVPEQCRRRLRGHLDFVPLTPASISAPSTRAAVFSSAHLASDSEHANRNGLGGPLRC